MNRVFQIVLMFVPIFISNAISAQTGDEHVKQLFEKLKTHNKIYPTEKAYLHFDKTYYAAGDTIYFKAYVTMGEKHLPSGISGVLHADLINTKAKIDQSIKLQLTNGVAWGDFALPDSLPDGTYRVRAWTNWMRNDPGSLFEKEIVIGSQVNNKVPESNTAKAVNARADLQFFPEGGELVSGIENKVAFKAIGTNGLGTYVKGIITDNTGKQVVEFASARLGMGYFTMMPEEGKTYKAELIYTDGTKDEVMLPQARDKGIALSVNNDSLQKATVSIRAGKAYFDENKGKDYTLVIYSGGIANTVDCRLDSNVITVDLIKRKLFTGVTRITLFSSANEPLCERLIFIQNYDQLNLDVATDKETYHPRDKVNIKLNAKTRADSAAKGHFSVSVVDESKVKTDENDETTILSDLLLTSDLKGYIEQPNYYFNNITGQKLKELDLVMLTHGYCRFTWKQVLDSADNKPAYQPEKGLEISGVATSVLGKPINKGTVSLISQMGGPVLSQTTDEKGNFRFSNLVFTDTVHFVLNATNANGKNNTKLVYHKDINPAVSAASASNHDNIDQPMKAYLANTEKQQEQLNALGLGKKGRMLKEVKIKGIKENNNYRSSSLMGPGHANQVVHAEELEKTGGMLSIKLAGKFRGRYGYAITSSGNFPGLVMLDGVRWNFPLDYINPNAVETVELFYDANASIYGMEGAKGVLVITTKQGSGLQAKDISSTGVLPITVNGFYKAREFYAPKYEHPGNNANLKDLRSTIYWQPELKTDKEGNASFEYYNADGTGTCKVTIEGMDEKGNIGRQVFRYKVE
ncbi:TonB-dependent receptor plug domain-containing protein [Mucilaginibacter ginsenosidivorans]|uniref:TonB-dependent receptor n=1 Tax=Mucilaginibacter ginsenosidivorans TaxID=398053 RepID=A0A5B8V477_9SPHI|nr:TonB-dependent receptor plug domain-containing protein [Mucilaginibacter ginsenosidivorans]QEC65386.1 TonB-dependent receptor [Mucilaginibacter ginsenosidivorans]